jgi:hypothetical protein
MSQRMILAPIASASVWANGFRGHRTAQCVHDQKSGNDTGNHNQYAQHVVDAKRSRRQACSAASVTTKFSGCSTIDQGGGKRRLVASCGGARSAFGHSASGSLALAVVPCKRKDPAEAGPSSADRRLRPHESHVSSLVDSSRARKRGIHKCRAERGMTARSIPRRGAGRGLPRVLDIELSSRLRYCRMVLIPRDTRRSWPALPAGLFCAGAVPGSAWLPRRFFGVTLTRGQGAHTFAGRRGTSRPARALRTRQRASYIGSNIASWPPMIAADVSARRPLRGSLINSRIRAPDRRRTNVRRVQDTEGSPTLQDGKGSSPAADRSTHLKIDAGSVARTL